MARRLSVSALRTSGPPSTTSPRRVAIGPVPPPDTLPRIRPSQFAISRNADVRWASFSLPRGGWMKAPRRTLHYAWVVLGALVVVMLLGSGLRAVFGVFIKPMETTFGWDRAALSGAAAISLLLLGAAGPIVGWLADQWGPRRVIFLSAILLGLGATLSSRGSALWQIYITSGGLKGQGAGGGGMSTGAALAPRC